MEKKIIEIVSSILIIAGFFVLLGTVGSSDLDLLSDLDFIVQSSIGLILLTLGVVIMRKGEKYYV